MVSSDSDYFESADEDTEEPVGVQRTKKKVLKTNVNKEGSSSRQNVDLKANVDEGWDDFDIDGDLEVENNQSLPPPTVKQSSKSNEEPSTSAQDVKMVESGWEDFDDWGEPVEANKQKNKSTTNETTVHGQASQLQDQNMASVTENMSELEMNEEQGGWGWNSWGVGSILNTASVGINTLTTHVSQGLSSVTSALETGIGAPDPEELARRTSQTPSDDNTFKSQEPMSSEQSQNESAFAFNSLISGVSHITKLVETTGTKVISGGLGTLETIGKKTMEVLQDGDPGLQKKRAFLGLDGGEKPVLSQVLREAKEKADEEDKKREEKRQSKEVHYETLFDDFEGLVNLEALEMLSRQVTMQIQDKLDSSDSERKKEIKETLQQVAELCECPESDSEDENDDGDADPVDALRGRLQASTSEMGVEVQFDNILSRYRETLKWLEENVQHANSRSLYTRAISSLAEHTSIAVQLYLRTSQLLIVKQRRSTADEADSLAQLNSVLISLIKDLSTRFTTQLIQRTKEMKDQRSDDHVVNIHLEAGNSTKLINNAFQLMLPVLQIGAV